MVPQWASATPVTPQSPSGPPAPAQDVARRILGSAWWAGFTFNGITRCEKGTYALVSGRDWGSGVIDRKQRY